MLHFVDHLLVLLVTVVFPVVGYFGYRDKLKRFRAGEDLDRPAMYMSTVTVQWCMCGVWVLWWLFMQRDWSAIGLGVTVNEWAWIAVALVLGATGLLIAQIVQLKNTPDDRIAPLYQSVHVAQPLLPRSDRDFRAFCWLGLTAGIVEEVLWRGVLIWYLNQFVSFEWAMALSIVVFTLGHSYQGASQLVGVGLIACLLTLVYWLTGSLFLAMLLHVAIDIFQGKYAFDLEGRHVRLAHKEGV